MSRRLTIALLAALLGATSCAPSPPSEPSAAFASARQKGSSPAREWRTYLGNDAVSHASPLDQINRGNVAQLEVAWRYDAGGIPEHGLAGIQFNPLIVKGVLYGVSPALRVFALDAASGEELWSYQPDVDVELWVTCRGAAYWEDQQDERVIVGAGPYLYALDARTGRPIDSFGEGGRLDLRNGLGRELSDSMGVVATTPPSIYEDLLIVGGRVGEGHGAAPGHIRGFDIKSGEQRWIFHTIPHPGEVGHETWPSDAWQRSGGANAWAGFSVDAERGLVFAPTGSATFDFHGGDRAGDNLFANSLLALDARTGERRWHYQTVRHDIWDRDLPSPPNLVELERNGKRIPAVAQVTKTGDTFVFHRETGEPLFPIREEPVVGSAADGEVPAASQPVPTRPPPFVRQQFTLDLVTQRTPQAHAAVLERAKGMRFGSLYIPPSVEGTIQYPGTDGGAEWGGAAWDAETGLLFVNANQVPAIHQLIEAPKSQNMESPAGGYVFICAGCHGLDMRGGGSVPSLLDVSERLSPLEVYRVIRDGRGRMPGFAGYTAWYGLAAVAYFVYTADAKSTPASWSQGEGPKQFVNAGYQYLVDGDQLPGSKPPWGTLSAIDLQAGEMRWQIPFGDYREIVEAGKQGLGSENYGGAVVTAGGLLFIGATPDARIRAYDKRTGQELWSADLPTGGFATPATYEADGRQYVVIAAGGGKLRNPAGAEYVAFALPRGPAEN